MGMFLYDLSNTLGVQDIWSCFLRLLIIKQKTKNDDHDEEALPAKGLGHGGQCARKL